MSRLCFVLTENSIEECLEVYNNLETKVDIVELRLDFLNEESQSNLDKFKIDVPVILTFRKKVDGGLYDGDEEYRLCILKKGIETGNYSFVDLEEDLPVTDLDTLAKDKGVRVIRSFHDFNGVPENLANRLMGIKKDSDEIPKAAVMINSIKELLSFYKEAQSIANEEKIILGMGNYGFNTRILAEKIGSYLTFTSKESGKAAPGHATPDVLDSVYRFKNINSDTNVMGIIGNPVMHTKSPVIHNKGYKQLGLDSTYVPFEVDDLSLFLEVASMLDIKGFSVTVPFKNDIIPLLDSITDGVKEIGACNTVTNIDGKWIGENTDYVGFINPLIREYGDLRGKKVSVIGAGGAAKAALFALKNEGAEVLILNRTVEKAKELAEQFNVKYCPLNSESAEDIKEYSDVIVQTTNVGMHPLEHIDPLSFYNFTGNEFLYDIIYAPEETLFLKKGKEAGCKILNGWDMLLEQGYRQFKLFTGYDYPIK